MTIRTRRCLFVQILIGVLSFMTAAAQEVALITEWNLSDPTVGPAYMAADGQGGFWFTESSAVRLGHFDPATGLLREWDDPSPFRNHGIAVDDQGFVWYAVTSRALLRFDPVSYRFESFDIPTSFPIPFMVHVAGQVCTTEFFRNAIGCLDPARLDPRTDVFTEWPIPGVGFLRLQITLDPDGNVWFGQFEDGVLSKLDPLTDELTRYTLPDPDAGPFATRSDAEGRLWITESLSSAVARFDPDMATGTTTTVSPTVTTVTLDASVSNVIDWGVEMPAETTLQPVTSLVVSRSAPNFEEWLLPTVPAGTGDLAVVNDRRVWFLEFEAGKLGALDLDIAADVLIDAVDETVEEMGDLITALGVNGANGLVAKLAAVADRVRTASSSADLDAALAQLAAFNHQVDAKTGTKQGQIPPADAADLLVASALLETWIDKMRESF